MHPVQSGSARPMQALPMVTCLLLLLPVPSVPILAQSNEPWGSAPFILDTLLTALRAPWSLAFLPSGEMLITEKHGGLLLYGGGNSGPLATPGLDSIYREAGSGLFDVVVDPGFVRNGFVYLTYAEGGARANRVAVYRARLERGLLTEGRVIFRTTPDKRGNNHGGGRLTFLPDESMLLTVGEGFDYPKEAQLLNTDLGKVVRISREGVPPPDNPFRGQSGVRAEIFSFGHRNPQGVLVDPRDGTIWLHEHGPRGGDELNRLRAGSNYGWPLTSHGVDYDGELISRRALAPGIEAPVLVWLPSIAPSGMALYLGTAFPEWHGDLFVGGLAERSLRRIRIRNGEVILQEVLLRGLGERIRDVRVGPDGSLYLLTDAPAGMLLRVRRQ